MESMANLEASIRKVLFPDGEFEQDVRRTYVTLRWWMGGIGALLPVVLVLWGRFVDDISWGDMHSLSAFYWLHRPTCETAPLRDYFVGSLCAVGISLIIYYGYGRLENWLLNFAGAAAIVVALQPMAWPEKAGGGISAHGCAAVVFFLLIAATIWLCAGKTLHERLDPKVVRRWKLRYRLLAIGMIAAPLASWAIAEKSHWTIWTEALGVWVFSTYWLAKTYELLNVSQLEPTDAPAPKLRWTGGKLEPT
jgi:hypothetical protein